MGDVLRRSARKRAQALSADDDSINNKQLRSSVPSNLAPRHVLPSHFPAASLHTATVNMGESLHSHSCKVNHQVLPQSPCAQQTSGPNIHNLDSMLQGAAGRAGGQVGQLEPWMKTDIGVPEAEPAHFPETQLASPKTPAPRQRRKRTPRAAAAAACPMAVGPAASGAAPLMSQSPMLMPATGPPVQSPLMAAAAALRQATLDSEEALRKGVDHLCAVEPRLSSIFKSAGLPVKLLAKSGSAFHSLAQSIASQQVSGKAAAAIFGRLLQACNGVTPASQLDPAAVMLRTVEDLRACGLSERKATYLLGLAQHFCSPGGLSDASIRDMGDEELLAVLTKVKGIGPWTVDMLAMFHLGRPDVLPVGDLGVRKGVQSLFGLRALPSPSEMRALTEAWRPYRSVGSWCMWRMAVPPQKRTPAKSRGGGAAADAKQGTENGAVSNAVPFLELGDVVTPLLADAAPAQAPPRRSGKRGRTS
mmetsp:Transcript_12679/g.27453  ORF Transcript_12679/g.27453 Transcript_12679/m.27453 type:complete len:475 (-) Transcript_12679:484-1908(-)